MSAFVRRDARLARIDAAISRDAGLAPLLADERARYLVDDWTVADRTVEQAGLDLLWSTPDAASTLREDPVARALRTRWKTSPAQIAAVVALHRTAGTRSQSFRSEVLAVLGGRVAALEELIVGAHRLWLLGVQHQRPYPFDDVGVLLPVRLETLFTEAAAGWELKLRVIPEPPSLDSFSTHIPDGQLKAAGAFWSVVGLTGRMRTGWLDRPVVKGAFAQLANAVGPARAAWLVTATRGVATVDGGHTAMPIEEVPEPADPGIVQHVVGLPPRLSVVFWLYDGDEEKITALGTLPTQADARIDPVIDVRLFSRPSEAHDDWLVDWDAAVRVGLAGTFRLPAGVGPMQLGGLAVVGLGDEEPHELMEHQILSGTLSEVALGSATNSVGGDTTALSTQRRDGDAAVDGSPDLEAFRVAARERITRSAPLPRGFDATLTTFIAGSGRLPAVPRPPARADREAMESHADDPVASTGLSRLMVRALWPSLWGSSLFDAWGITDRGPAIHDWAFEHLYPEGPLPVLRFGEQPYGVLPVTSLRAWVPGAEVASPAVIADLAVSVQRIQSGLHTRLRPVGSVRIPDGTSVNPERYTELLGRGGSSRAFHYATYERNTGLAGIDDYRDALERALDLVGLALPPEFSIPVTDPWPVDLALVQPPHSSVWGNGDFWRRFPLPYLLDMVFGLGELVNWPHGQALQVDDVFAAEEFSVVPEVGGEGHVRLLPDSLLARLLVQAAVTSNGWRAAGAIGTPPDLSRWIQQYAGGRPDDQISSSMMLARLLDDHRIEDPGRDLIAGTNIPDFAVHIEPARRARLERALGATIDAVSTRVDALAGTFAWQRLRATVDGDCSARRLGAYGWVYGPFIGAPGPTASGLLHTPSLAQTVTATILRDEYLDGSASGTTNERLGTPWDMNLTSSTVRLAQDFAEDVRAGMHLWQVVGQEVERIVGGPDAPAGSPAPYLRISALRMDYPIYPDRRSPHKVCDGLSAATGLVSRDAAGGWVAADAAHPLASVQVQQLGQVHDALDALADLLVIDGMTHAVSRATGRTAADLDAAAGLGRMPSLDYPQTKPSGFISESTVLSLVPWVSAEPGDSPARCAEPSVAALLDSRLGVLWTWTIDFETGPARTVTLSELGLTPIDTLALSHAQLGALAAAAAGGRDVSVSEGSNQTWHITVGAVDHGTISIAPIPTLLGTDLSTLSATAAEREVLRAVLGVSKPPANSHAAIVASDDPRMWTLVDELGNAVARYDATALGGAAAADTLPSDEIARRLRELAGLPAVSAVLHPVELEGCTELCRLLGAPATGRQLAHGPSAPSIVPAFEELRERYQSVHAALVADEAAAAAAGRLGVAGRSQQAAAIRRGVGWGVTPDATPADARAFLAAMSGTDAPRGATSFRDLARQVASALKKRRLAAPLPSSLKTPAQMEKPLTDPTAARESGVPDGVAALARLLSALVAPQGALPILIPWDSDRLRAVTGLDAAPVDGLDVEWLTVVATVREPLARLEAVQLSSHPFTTWSSSPDPWLSPAIAANRAAREHGSVEKIDVPRLVTAYGPAGALGGARVAAGIVDAFSEAVPMRERDTHAAFGFNVPAARAPQGILLAVPPMPGTRLDDDVLHEILRHARELLVARTATVEDLGPFDRVMRSVWLPDSVPTGIFDTPAYRAQP